MRSCGAPAAHPPAGHGAHTYTYFMYGIDTHTHAYTRWVKLSSLQEDAGALSSPDTRGKLALGSVFPSTRPLRKKGKSKPSHPFGAGAAHRSGSSLSSPQPLPSRIAPFHPHLASAAPFWVRGCVRGPLRQPGPAGSPRSAGAHLQRAHTNPPARGKPPPPPRAAQVWPVQIRSHRGGDGAGGGFPPTLVVAFSPRVRATFFKPPPQQGWRQPSPANIPAHINITRREHLGGETPSLKTAPQTP